MACPHDTRLTWVGHASFVLQMAGRTVLIDPVWSSRIAGGIRRLCPLGVEWDQLPAIDAVLITHNHFDHLDAPTLKRLPRATPVFVPAGLGRWFRRRGFTAVTELDWWETAEAAGLQLDFVPAHHWSRRGIMDTNRSLWGGWVVSARHAPKIYFSGDTAYGHFFAEIGRRHPAIDVAVLPIGAYAPRATNGNAHTDPEEALQAHLDLGAKSMVPMHWATFRLGQEPLLEPIERLEGAWRSRGLSQGSLLRMDIGQTRTIPAAASACRCRPARRPRIAAAQPRALPANPAPAIANPLAL